MSTAKTLNIAILISTVLALMGCATGSKDSILPQDGPTMKEVYEGHFTGQNLHQDHAENTEKEEVEDDISETEINKVESGQTLSKKQRLQRNQQDDQTGPVDLSTYTRQASNEIRQIFPRLRNKTLLMYVFPHLSKGERYPIPGYSTAFTLYQQTEYALPGETEEGY